MTLPKVLPNTQSKPRNTEKNTLLVTIVDEIFFSTDIAASITFTSHFENSYP